MKKKKNSISISAYCYESKEKYPIYVPTKCCEDKHIIERRRRQKALFYYQRFKYLNVKYLKIPKEDESIRFKNYQGKIKSPFMI